jgi:hypothetical protein
MTAKDWMEMPMTTALSFLKLDADAEPGIYLTGTADLLTNS